MSSSIQKSNARLAIYTAPVAISFIFALATGGVINVPFVAILSSIQALLGQEGFTFLKETLTLLGSGGVNLLTGEAHERFKGFLQGFQTEKLSMKQNFRKSSKKRSFIFSTKKRKNPNLPIKRKTLKNSSRLSKRITRKRLN